ncbi:DNA translocase FtsK [Acinetobacter larvae]|uniref:DNA translocase FtsK n=1 Tax=Acinetobacter larvae TaxID=1789224 RepID=A0A1B2M464_9GAMM|nr:DNA translocase FtsK [Acinetobacter larvae]AOA59996.1 DNA translocase FtsK [Acinetobacter larvae]
MTAVSSVYAQRFLVTIFLVSFGMYLFLATVTYTPFDPGWMHISSDTQQVSNASGVAGAWIADLLFGFLGWGSLLLPIFLFIEAVQVWWPRSALTRPFRYAAQFFILLTSAALLYLLWQVPADTLDNASGGIIGYELGSSLAQLLTVYGAVIFLAILWFVLLTLAFGIQWNRSWATLKATPAYLQELFYRNIPESESAYDLTEAKSTAKTTRSNPQQTVPAETVPAAQALVEPSTVDEQTVAQDVPNAAQQHLHAAQAQQLFADMQAQEDAGNAAEHIAAEPGAVSDDAFEQTIAKAHRLTQETQQNIASGEVWKALQQQNDHKQEIDALLRAAQEEPLGTSNTQTNTTHGYTAQSSAAQQVIVQPNNQTADHLDWNDDKVFDELLAAVPPAAGDLPRHHDTQPLNAAQQTSSVDMTVQLATELDNLAKLADQAAVSQDTMKQTSSYAQSTPLVRAAMQTTLNAGISEEEKRLIASDKDAFREAWQETAGVASVEEGDDIDFDFDAPLTDALGRPMSRAMQVAEKRRTLPTLPGLDILDKVDPNKKVNFSAEQLARLSELLEIKLQEFNVKAKVIEAHPGPVVTRFELDLAPGVKASKVTNISRDLARSMSMASVRVVEVIPGKPYIGIEVPNSAREMVRLIELLETPFYRDPSALISMAMGKDISGNPVLTDLAKAPHMLVAGTTGSGKSVAVNAMILSMLLKYRPDQLRLILIDPKQLELANYNDIPHLLTPVVTDMKDAVNALNWCVNEMERRYKLMSFLKIRKISDYNRKVEEAIANGEDLIDPTWKPSDSATQDRAPRLGQLPMIVIVADEFADMIMQVGKKAEEMITRLAQKSRAAGIHLLLATQRPSVDVITGLIKANIPTRVALRVNSKIDSRTILDAGGAEDLLGHGDMLFLGPGKIEPERVHGAFISDDEVNRICDAWRERGDPDYIDEILTPYDEESSSRSVDDGDGSPDRDALYDQCVAFVLETRKASTSSLQRKFSLGYNRAARIIDQMEEHGIVSSMGANGKREILV